MTYIVLQALNVKTKTGMKEIQPKQAITLPHDKAGPYVRKRMITPDLQDMWERLEIVYQRGDLDSLKQDKSFWTELELKEEAMSKAILSGDGYEESIQEYEEHFKHGLYRLRGMKNSELTKSINVVFRKPIQLSCF